MKIYGREVGLRLTCGASAKISKLCPNNDLSRLGELLDGADMASTIELTAKIACYLSEGYEQNKHFADPNHEVKPITFDEFMSLGMEELEALSMEIGHAIAMDSKGEINAVPAKGAKKK